MYLPIHKCTVAVPMNFLCVLSVDVSSETCARRTQHLPITTSEEIASVHSNPGSTDLIYSCRCELCTQEQFAPTCSVSAQEKGKQPSAFVRVELEK